MSGHWPYPNGGTAIGHHWWCGICGQDGPGFLNGHNCPNDRHQGNDYGQGYRDGWRDAMAAQITPVPPLSPQ